jgi:FKBP-type peptidyl-prolyl cis-trans isomerase
MIIRLALTSLLIVLSAVVAVSFAGDEVTVLESGLRYQDLVLGDGETAEAGKIATIHLVGWLDDSGRKGVNFFDSRDQDQPIMFRIGTERVMKAWNFGVVGMKSGGKRRLMVPASLGYGSKGVADIVPPDSDLILEIELVDVK